MTTTATDRWVQARTREYLDGLPPGLREDPGTVQVLAGLFAAIARVDVVPRNVIMGLPSLVRPDRLRRDFLPDLGTLVGFDDGVGFTRYLTETLWRRLLPEAGAIWRDKGLGYRDLIVALTGKPCWVGYWHQLRDQLDVTPLPLQGLDSDSPTVGGGQKHHERVAWVHVPDPYGNNPQYAVQPGEVAVNRDMLTAALDAVRAAQQRIDVYWYDCVDDFTQGAAGWATVQGAAPTVDPVDYHLAVPNGTVVRQAAGGIMATWEFGTWDLWVRIRATVNGTASVYVRYASDVSWYRLDLAYNVAEPTLGAMLLSGAAVGVIAHTSRVLMPVDQWLRLSITVSPDYNTVDGNPPAFFGGPPPPGPPERWTVYLDGNPILDDTNYTIGVTGGLALAGAGDGLDVQLVERYRAPAAHDRVGPNP